LSAAVGTLYVGVLTEVVGSSGSPSVTYSPGAFDTTEAAIPPAGISWMIAGSRLAVGSETPHIDTTWSGASNGIAVAAVFG
jgi:hypothetical protein